MELQLQISLQAARGACTCKRAVILVNWEPGQGLARLADGFEDAGIARVHAEGLQDVQLEVADAAAAADCHRRPPLPCPL